MQQDYIYMSGALTGLSSDDMRYVGELYDKVKSLC